MSTITFLIATVREGALIATYGIFIHSTFMENEDISMVNKIILENGLLMRVKIVILWADMFAVRPSKILNIYIIS